MVLLYYFKQYRCLLVAAACLLSALLPSGASETNSPKEGKVVLQLKWKHAFQFAGYYAAVEKGYYSSAGLEVELVEGGPETHFAEELASGRAHYAVALSSMLIHHNEGKPVVALAAILQHSPEVLLVLEKSGINTPHQMAGKTVAVSPEDTPALLAMFKNEGLSRDAVKTIPYEFDIGRMLKGDYAGMGGYTTNEPFQFRARGAGVRAIQPRDYGVDFYGDCLFTSGGEVRNHPQRVKAFLEASLKGWQYAMHHREEIIDLLINRYQCPLSREALRYEAQEMAELMFPDLIEIGHMNEGRWRHIGDTYVRLGMLKPDYSLDSFIYKSKPKDYSWLWWPVVISVITTLFLTAAVFSLVRINHRITHAEHRMRESQGLLQTILNTIPVAVFWKGTDLKYLGCNRVFSELAGLNSPEQVRGLSDLDLPWKMTNEEHRNKDREVVESGIPMMRYEEDETYPDGRILHFQKSKIPLRDPSGRIIGVLGVAQDITPLKESESRRLLMSEGIQETLKFESLHRFTGGLCHHFNNILQAILGNSELASNQLPKDHPTQAAIRHILSETRRASSLSRVLLVTIGHGIHRMQSLGLDDFIRGSKKALDSVLLPGQQLKLTTGAGDALVRADLESLRELVLNLVRNSSESLKDSSLEIHLQTGRMVCDRLYLHEPHLDADLPEGPYVYIDVIDQGEGMTQEELKKVFDPFFSTKYQGRGLGMSVVLGILRGHRGAVKIQSQKGKGTTVRVLFPELAVFGGK